MTENRTENIYSIATDSQLDLATMGFTFRRVSSHIDLAQRSGYQGVELWPQRFVPAIEINAGLLSPKERDGITSVHQSPRGPIRNKRGVWAGIFLPEINASLNGLDKIYDQVGDVPAVLFRQAPERYIAEASYSLKQIQIDPDTANAWGIYANDSMTKENALRYVIESQKRGFDGIVIDTHHIRRNSEDGKPNPLANWKESIPILLPYCQEIHIGVGRKDYGNVDPATIDEETRDLLTGGHMNTEVVKMLRLIADRGWRGLIVIEMRPSFVFEVMGKNKFVKLARSIGIDPDLISAYEGIKGTLYNIFEDNRSGR